MLPGKRTSDGAIYIAQGPPPAGTPFVGGIAVSHDGAIYVSQAFTPIFSPADLFQNNEQGAWYDPSDLSTMFQDSAGTIPVTAIGQPVGRINDKSGNGNNAIQSTAAARPLLQNDGVNNYLAFDGVDDAMATASFNLSLSTTASLFVGMDKINDTSAGWLFENSTGNARGISFAQRGTSLEIGFKTSDDTNETISPYPAQQKIVISALLDPNNPISQEKIGIRVDGASVEGSVWNVATAGNFGNFPLNIGKRSDGYYLGVHLYSLTILGRLTTPQEITDTETWVNGKTGAY